MTDRIVLGEQLSALIAGSRQGISCLSVFYQFPFGSLIIQGSKFKCFIEL